MRRSVHLSASKDLPQGENLRHSGNMGTVDPFLEKRLREEIAEWGSIRECARVLGFSRTYLLQVLSGTQPGSDKFLASLGLERRIHKIPKYKRKARSA